MQFELQFPLWWVYYDVIDATQNVQTNFQVESGYSAMTSCKASRAKQSAPTFRALVATLSNNIGHHHIPVVESAMHPSEIIAPDAVHYDLVKKVFRSLYRANHCYHLDAPVNFENTFDKLGTIYNELIHCDKTDIDQVRLLQDIGTQATKFFRKHNLLPQLTSPRELNDAHSGSESKVHYLGERFARTG